MAVAFKCVKCGGDGKVLYDEGGKYYHFDCQPSREGVTQKRCVDCRHIEDVGRERCYMCDGTTFYAVNNQEPTCRTEADLVAKIQEITGDLK